MMTNVNYKCKARFTNVMFHVKHTHNRQRGRLKPLADDTTAGQDHHCWRGGGGWRLFGRVRAGADAGGRKGACARPTAADTARSRQTGQGGKRAGGAGIVQAAIDACACEPRPTAALTRLTCWGLWGLAALCRRIYPPALAACTHNPLPAQKQPPAPAPP